MKSFFFVYCTPPCSVIFGSEVQRHFSYRGDRQNKGQVGKTTFSAPETFPSVGGNATTECPSPFFSTTKQSPPKAEFFIPIQATIISFLCLPHLPTKKPLLVATTLSYFPFCVFPSNLLNIS